VSATSTQLARLARLDSTVISDALDGLGLPPGTGTLRAQWGSPRISGTVRTVELEPDTGGAPGPHIATGAIDAACRGDVLVIANAGRTDVSSWGGLLSLGATARGLAGVVTDGACRDISEAEAEHFPVYARTTTPRTARGRLRQRSQAQPVTIDGITVAEGDLVVADDSGIAFIPAGHTEQVLQRAEAIAAREQHIATDVRAGASMARAMHDARLAGTSSPATEAGAGDRADEAAKQAGRARVTLAQLPTAAISDALDRLGLPGSLHGIHPVPTTGALSRRVCGPAFTAAYEPVDETGGTVGDFLDDVPPGAVVVIDNAGRTDCTVWGGIMSAVAASTGVAATVIHGTCRDLAAAERAGYPLWSTSTFMRTGKDRVRLRAVQEPLSIDGVTITPGDLVCADSDGVVVVPADLAALVAELAEQVEAAEDRVIDAVRAGATLAAARAEHGYHSLQTSQATSSASTPTQPTTPPVATTATTAATTSTVEEDQ